MKIFVPSYNRGNPPLPQLLWGAKIPFTVVVHNEAQKHFHTVGYPIAVTNVPVGMSNARQAILDQFVGEGEWCMMLDDNITGFTGVMPDYYDELSLPVKKDKKYKDIFEYPLSIQEFLDRAIETIDYAEKRGIEYCGFATNANHFFREKKWRDVGYVIGRAILIKKHLRYDLNVTMMDDYAYTAEHLKQNGKVLINNYVLPVKKHYEMGGCGTYEQRLPMKIADCQYLMRKFPGLFRYKKKSGTHHLAELQVAFTHNKQVEVWRASLK